MASADRRELEVLLAPLFEALPSGRVARLVARPNWVMVDRAEGSEAAAVAWPLEVHQRGLELVGDGYRRGDGVAVRRAGDALVLRRPPDVQLRVETLVQEGRLSGMAARLLGASLAIGRNLLVVGGTLAAEELVAAIVADGRRPAVLGGPTTAVPATWPLLAEAGEVSSLGADRVALFDLDWSRLVGLLTQGHGMAACVPGRRLDQALMRYELAAERGSVRGASPLHVLAGIDLVAVIGGEAARLTEIASIELAEDGYRPRLLFATGLPPVTNALVPVGAPSFLEELAGAGHTLLAEELQHAAGSASTAAPAPAPAPIMPRLTASLSPPANMGESRGPTGAMVAEPPPRFDPALADAPPPGWELDQLGESMMPGEPAGHVGSESATLAATFGLGPPPAPPGVAPLGAEILASDGSGFAEALRRARERDEELRVSEAEAGEEEP